MFVDATSHQHLFYFDFPVDKNHHSGSVNFWHNDSGTILQLYHMQKETGVSQIVSDSINILASVKNSTK